MPFCANESSINNREVQHLDENAQKLIPPDVSAAHRSGLVEGGLKVGGRGLGV